MSAAIPNDAATAKPLDIKFGNWQMFEAALSISGDIGKPSRATMYAEYYDRMQAVIAAARSGDPLLLKLALEFYDKHGIALHSGTRPKKKSDFPKMPPADAVIHTKRPRFSS